MDGFDWLVWPALVTIALGTVVRWVTEDPDDWYGEAKAAQQKREDEEKGYRNDD